MEEKGFYKYENGELFYAPNFVISQNFELYKALKDEYKYPVYDWYWFETGDDAYDFFQIEKPEVDPKFDAGELIKRGT